MLLAVVWSCAGRVRALRRGGRRVSSNPRRLSRSRRLSRRGPVPPSELVRSQRFDVQRVPGGSDGSCCLTRSSASRGPLRTVRRGNAIGMSCRAMVRYPHLVRHDLGSRVSLARAGLYPHLRCHDTQSQAPRDRTPALERGPATGDDRQSDLRDALEAAGRSFTGTRARRDHLSRAAPGATQMRWAPSSARPTSSSPPQGVGRAAHRGSGPSAPARGLREQPSSGA